MDDKIVAAIIGAMVGSFLTFLANWFLSKGKHRNDAFLQMAMEVLGYFNRTLNREAPEQLKKNVPELRNEWAMLNRGLYLLRVSDRSRREMDNRMTSYLRILEEFREKPDRRGEVDRERDLAKEEAYRLMRRLGL